MTTIYDQIYQKAVNLRARAARLRSTYGGERW